MLEYHLVIIAIAVPVTALFVGTQHIVIRDCLFHIITIAIFYEELGYLLWIHLLRPIYHHIWEPTMIAWIIQR